MSDFCVRDEHGNEVMAADVSEWLTETYYPEEIERLLAQFHQLYKASPDKDWFYMKALDGRTVWAMVAFPDDKFNYANWYGVGLFFPEEYPT